MKTHLKHAFFLFFSIRSTGNTLDELHRFFEDDLDDYRLEIEAEVRLKALYSCLVVCEFIITIKPQSLTFFLEFNIKNNVTNRFKRFLNLC